jgi:aspartyl-tRNA(Asn)/glutamyl-tRNA(Gln) amidotransferase subunit A
METKAGSEAYQEGVAEKDAECVARLRDAGAIILGKTVTTEFAFRNPSQSRNPWNTDYTPGGSSAGSGAAVGDRMCLAALGTQTAGSVLRPAAFNGVTGFKPSLDEISTAGVVPLSWQLDHVGTLTRTVEDAHLLWHIMRRQHTLDWQSTRNKLPPPLRPKAPARIWRIREFFELESSPECLVNLEKACLRLEQNGARIVEQSLPDSFKGLDETHQIIMATEAGTAHKQRFAEHSQFYSHHMADLVREGQAMKATDYIEARRHRERMREDFAAAMRDVDVDVAIMPSSVTPPPNLRENITGNARFNRPWSLCGNPSLSIATDVTEENLPLAVQLACAPHMEERLLEIGGWCESVIGFRAQPA